MKYELGGWDLSDLVKNPKSPAFEKQIQLVEKKAKQFEKIKTKLEPKMPQKKFFGILHEIEDISEKMSVVSGFASLSYASDTQSDEATSLL
ncbi:MAG: oligoendopeptidase F, partial [Nitrosopumilaceae archaeon]